MIRRISLFSVLLAIALSGCDRQPDDSAPNEESAEKATTEKAAARTPETETTPESSDDQPTSRDAESDDAREDESSEDAAARRPEPKAETAPDNDREPDVASARRDHTTQLWVGGRSKQDGEVRAAVDVRELGIFEFDGLEDLMGMRAAGPAPYETGALPEPFDDLERVDVLTSGGVVELAIEDVRPHSYGPRASDQTFWLRTEASEKVDETIGENTLMAPAGAMGDDATYRTVEGERPDEEIVSDLRDGVLEHLDEEQMDKLENAFPPKGFEPEQQERLEAGESLVEILGEDHAREFGREHFTIVEGSFPAPHDLFVAVNGPKGNGGVHNQRFPIVRMSLFAREDGTVTDLRFRGLGPNHELGHPAPAEVDPIAAADPDGDGTEGLLVRHDDEVDWIDFDSQER